MEEKAMGRGWSEKPAAGQAAAGTQQSWSPLTLYGVYGRAKMAQECESRGCARYVACLVPLCRLYKLSS